MGDVRESFNEKSWCNAREGAGKYVWEKLSLIVNEPGRQPVVLDGIGEGGGDGGGNGI